MSPEPVRIGVLGCGNVGAALVEQVRTRAHDIALRTGLRLEIARVAVRSVSKDRQVDLPPGVLTRDAAEVAVDPGIDVVVEMIGGIEPARELTLAALRAGKPVVSANKELLANHGAELFAAAEAAGVDLLFEAAVGGGIPFIRPLRESLAGERIDRVMGIVNGTTNYVLSRMSDEGVSYAEALAEAQGLGYAERDPTADVEGHDAAAKAAIIASIAFGAKVTAGEVYNEGISGIRSTDIEYARKLDFVVKLLAITERHPVAAHDRARADDPTPTLDATPTDDPTPTDGSTGILSGFPSTPHDDPSTSLGSAAGMAAGRGDEISVRVHPAMVPVDHPLASVRESFNALFVEGEAVGDLMFYGRGAGGAPTASAVLGDLIDAAANRAKGSHASMGTLARARLRPIDEVRSAYYLNVEVVDRPGVLAAVAGVFGDHGVSIRSMEQAGMGDEARIVFITHEAREADLQATIGDLHQLDAVDRIASVLRVIGRPDT